MPQKRDQRNIDLKRDHTFRVVGEISALGKKLNLDDADLELARIMALFHDLGRFEQYSRYGTFMDSQSRDHAEMSLEIIEREKILDCLEPKANNLIKYCIGWHNKKTLPFRAGNREGFFSRLLRDADKLDIWKVVTGYYQKKDRAPNNAIELGLPDKPEISPDVMGDIMAGRLVDSGHIRTTADFKALQMGWVFDVNFAGTFELLAKRRYLEALAAALPRSNAADRIYERVSSHLNERLAG